MNASSRLAVLASIGVGIAASPAAAQSSPGVAPPSGAEAPIQIEEILVTARRQEESLQTTPVAVTAITGVTLARQQILDVSDLQRSAPNLSISTGGASVSTLTFPTIRGQSSLGGTASNDPAVGVYVDGVYVGRPGGSLLDLIDVERVEVLRGPQGTLFGRNTTGGALSITSNQPKDELGGSAQLRIGNFDTYEATGVLNVPLSQTLATRIVYQHSERSGYVHNAFLDRHINDRNNEFVRGAIKYTSPGGTFDFLLTADYTNLRNNGQPTVLFAYNPTIPALGTFVRNTGPDENGPGPADDTLDPYVHNRDNFYRTYSNEREYTRLEAGGVSGILNVDLGDVSLKSITA